MDQECDRISKMYEVHSSLLVIHIQDNWYCQEQLQPHHHGLFKIFEIKLKLMESQIVTPVKEAWERERILQMNDWLSTTYRTSV